MTPKNKAKELVDKYLYCKINNYGFEYAKKCALIAVDEIINCDSFFSKLADLKEFTEYWYEVKQEIKY